MLLHLRSNWILDWVEITSYQNCLCFWNRKLHFQQKNLQLLWFFLFFKMCEWDAFMYTRMSLITPSSHVLFTNRQLVFQPETFKSPYLPQNLRNTMMLHQERVLWLIPLFSIIYQELLLCCSSWDITCLYKTSSPRKGRGFLTGKGALLLQLSKDPTFLTFLHSPPFSRSSLL